MYILVLLFQITIPTGNVDSLLKVLELKMEKRAFYDSKKESRIKTLIQAGANTTDLNESYLIFDKVVSEYQFYDFNNALKTLEANIERARLLSNNVYLNKSQLQLSLLLVDSGRYKESIDALSEIKRDSLPKVLLNDYYLAYEEAYSGLFFNTTVKQSKALYSKLYELYSDSLYSRVDLDSEIALRLKEKQYRDARNLAAAMVINNKRLSRTQMGSREFSLITFERSLLHELRGHVDKQKETLILSAISDIETSIKDNASLGTLAKIYFGEGDVERAHKYINFSFDDAQFYNSQLRFVNIANSLPVITKSYEELRSTQKKKLEIYLISISVLALFLIGSVYLVFKQIKKVTVARNKLSIANEKLIDFNSKLNHTNEDLKRLYKELSESNKVKEHYIGTFLNLYSEYITKLDVYRKLVSKYVKANQMNSLLELSKSKQLIVEELEIFNKNFDSSFLHIHPNFVSEVNKLLKPDSNIVLVDQHTLNTELRILALIKLGITSSSRIALILRYSVNTIYNYRANIKSLAIDKAAFEDLIKEIP